MKKLLSRIKAHFFNGLLALIPVGVTAYLSYRIFRIVYSFMDFGTVFIPQKYRSFPFINQGITVSTIFLTIFFIWFIGYIVRTYVGKGIRKRLHRIIMTIPLAGIMYRAFRQLMDIAFLDTAKSFSRVVLVEFPHPGCKVIAFLTGDATGKLAASGEDGYKVFVPGTPNPTSGFLLVVPRDKVVMTNLTVEQGLRSIVSGGMLHKTEKPKPVS